MLYRFRHRGLPVFQVWKNYSKQCYISRQSRDRGAPQVAIIHNSLQEEITAVRASGVSRVPSEAVVKIFKFAGYCKILVWRWTLTRIGLALWWFGHLRIGGMLWKS